MLSTLDHRLAVALQRGKIRLIRSSWLLLLPPGSRIQFRQELEALEASGEASPLLSPDEAVALLAEGNRSVAALTYGWLVAGTPDPTKHRLACVRQALQEHPHIKGLFWDFASLYQARCNPPAHDTSSLVSSVGVSRSAAPSGRQAIRGARGRLQRGDRSHG